MLEIQRSIHTKSEYKLSVLEEFESNDPQVKKWLKEITRHATSNPCSKKMRSGQST